MTQVNRTSVTSVRFVPGRAKRALDDPFGLTSLGVNLTTLAPHAMSALKHVHSVSDEFIHVLEGVPRLVAGDVERELARGDCAGFAANGVAHHIVDRSDAVISYLEIGDRARTDTASYPDDHLVATRTDEDWGFVEGEDGVTIATKFARSLRAMPGAGPSCVQLRAAATRRASSSSSSTLMRHDKVFPDFPIVPFPSAWTTPWTDLGNSAGVVIATRLTMMPWLLITNPDGAAKEMHKMVDEKQAALQETVAAFWLAPWHFWMDIAAAGPFASPRSTVTRAVGSAGRRLASPASRRVKANRKRLAAGI